MTATRTTAANALFVRQNTARFVRASFTFSVFFFAVALSRGAE